MNQVAGLLPGVAQYAGDPEMFGLMADETVLEGLTARY